MTYVQSKQHSNEVYSKLWVQRNIQKYVNARKGCNVLDVGAGLSPYKLDFEALGSKYFSHDFNKYVPSTSMPGLQNNTWIYPNHNFICEVLEIPESEQYDFLICTEVLEHVPDPVEVLKKLVKLTNSGGHILITTPFLSLMHQSPFWFSSGLSPFWIEYWSKELNLEVCELEVSGDFLDLMEQEISRLLFWKRPVKGLTRLSKLVRIFRRFIPAEVLQSGGFGTFCVLYKK